MGRRWYQHSGVQHWLPIGFPGRTKTTSVQALSLSCLVARPFAIKRGYATPRKRANASRSPCYVTIRHEIAWNSLLVKHISQTKMTQVFVQPCASHFTRYASRKASNEERCSESTSAVILQASTPAGTKEAGGKRGERHGRYRITKRISREPAIRLVPIQVFDLQRTGQAPHPRRSR